MRDKEKPTPIHSNSSFYLSPWERIEALVKYFGFASVSALSRELGLRTPETLYQVKRGNAGIRTDLADTIVTAFPEVSRAWLLTGGGSMLTYGQTTEIKLDPSNLEEPEAPQGTLLGEVVIRLQVVLTDK